MLTTDEVIAEAEGLDRSILEDYVQTQQRRWPQGGAACLSTVAGLAAFDGTGRDSRLAGLTDRDPGWSQALGTMLRWHAERRARAPDARRHPSCRIVLAPGCSPKVAAALARRRCRFRSQTPVLGRALTDLPILDGGGIEVIEAGPALRWTAIDTIARGYLDGGEPHALDLRAAETWFDLPDATHFLAYRGDEIAGGAAIVRRGASALLAQMAVLPSHRRHGVQRALLMRRLAHGRTEGAERVYLTTAPRGASLRNAQRAGFSMLYTRISFTG